MNERQKQRMKRESLSAGEALIEAAHKRQEAVKREDWSEVAAITLRLQHRIPLLAFADYGMAAIVMGEDSLLAFFMDMGGGRES